MYHLPTSAGMADRHHHEQYHDDHEDVLKTALVEIERLEVENHELYGTIDVLQAKCNEFEEENNRLKETGAEGKNEHQRQRRILSQKREASIQRLLLRHRSSLDDDEVRVLELPDDTTTTMLSGSNSSFDLSGHSNDPLAFDASEVSGATPTPTELVNQSSFSDQMIKFTNSIRDFRLGDSCDDLQQLGNTNTGGGGNVPPPPPTPPPAMPSSPSPPSSLTPTTAQRKHHRSWRKRIFKSADAIQTETESALLRQLDVLQEDKLRQVAELEMKLRQRESAISTLEQSLKLKDSTIKILRDQFEDVNN